MTRRAKYRAAKPNGVAPLLRSFAVNLDSITGWIHIDRPSDGSGRCPAWTSTNSANLPAIPELNHRISMWANGICSSETATYIVLQGSTEFAWITRVKCQCRSCSLERRIVLSLSNRIKLLLVKLMREDGCRMGSHLLARRSAGRISGRASAKSMSSFRTSTSSSVAVTGEESCPVHMI